MKYPIDATKADTSKMTQSEYEEWYMYVQVERMLWRLIFLARKHINKRHKKIYGHIRYM